MLSGSDRAGMEKTRLDDMGLLKEMNEPSGFHSIFQGSQGKSCKQIPPYNSQAPCTVFTLSFSFLPVRLEGQGILLSVSHLGEMESWHEEQFDQVKVRPR